MKISLCIFFTCLFFTAPVLAQKDTLKVASLTDKADAMTAKLTHELSLNDAQRQEVYNLLFSRLEKLKNGEDIRTVNNQTRNQFTALLATPQLDLYIKLREETRKQKDEFLRNNPGYRFSREDEEMDF
jgi:hypothetical protein